MVALSGNVKVTGRSVGGGKTIANSIGSLLDEVSPSSANEPIDTVIRGNLAPHSLPLPGDPSQDQSIVLHFFLAKCGQNQIADAIPSRRFPSEPISNDHFWQLN